MKEECKNGFADAGFALDVLSRGGDVTGDVRLCHLCAHEMMPSCPHHGIVIGICKSYIFNGISSDEIAKIIVQVIPRDQSEEVPQQTHFGF